MEQSGPTRVCVYLQEELPESWKEALTASITVHFRAYGVKVQVQFMGSLEGWQPE